MATEFQMPKLGLTMEAGTILEWSVADGSRVSAGDVLLVIETDKVESEIESSGAGILKQTGDVGETYDCGVRIGWFLEEGELAPAEPDPAPSTSAPSASTPSTSAPSTSVPAGAGPVGAAAGVAGTAVATRGDGGRILASPNARRVAADLGVSIDQVAGSGPGGRITSEDVEEAARHPRPVAAPAGAIQPAGPTVGARRALATFGARQMADLLGVDLDGVVSLTSDPRLTKDDVVAHVRAALAGQGERVASAPEADDADGPSYAPLLQTPPEVVPLRGMRGTIASRMHTSLQEMAQLTLMMDVDMGEALADRERRKGGDGEAAPGVTDYVIAAAAKALSAHGYANSQITAEGVAHLPEVHVGMAVAVDNGLMVPVIRNTPTLDLASLAAETSRLAAATRAGELQLTDMEGGTFSVTALGMYGVDGFTPVINPPNTAILGVGRLRDEVRWVDGQPTRASVLTLSLTWDHRAFDGAPAAEFTSTIKTILEAGDLS